MTIGYTSDRGVADALADEARKRATKRSRGRCSCVDDRTQRRCLGRPGHPGGCLWPCDASGCRGGTVAIVGGLHQGCATGNAAVPVQELLRRRAYLLREKRSERDLTAHAMLTAQIEIIDEEMAWRRLRS